MKTTRSGCADTAGIRYLNQSARCCLTLVRRRSAATSDFFVRKAELAEQLANRIRMRAHAGCVMQGRRKFRQRDVAILRNDLGEEDTVRVEFAHALGPTLGRRTGLTRPPD